MNLKFKLVPGTGIDGIVQSIRAMTSDPIIDIHIERGEVEVKSRPSGYKSPNTAMREFYESESDGIEKSVRKKKGGKGAIFDGAQKAAAKLSQVEKDHRDFPSMTALGMFDHKVVVGWDLLNRMKRERYQPPVSGCRCEACEDERTKRGF